MSDDLSNSKDSFSSSLMDDDSPEEGKYGNGHHNFDRCSSRGAQEGSRTK